MSVFVNQIAFSEKLVIEVGNIKDRVGNIAIAVFKSKKGFPDDEKSIFFHYQKSVNELPIELDLPHGEYAITLFQDLNRDKVINKRWIGTPKEPFGFSNNPRLFFGPPSYERSKFIFNKPTTLSIHLKYL